MPTINSSEIKVWFSLITWIESKTPHFYSSLYNSCLWSTCKLLLFHLLLVPCKKKLIKVLFFVSTGWQSNRSTPCCTKSFHWWMVVYGIVLQQIYYSAVERKNQDSKDKAPQQLQSAMINLHKTDKCMCTKHTATMDGISVWRRMSINIKEVWGWSKCHSHSPWSSESI